MRPAEGAERGKWRGAGSSGAGRRGGQKRPGHRRKTWTPLASWGVAPTAWHTTSDSAIILVGWRMMPDDEAETCDGVRVWELPCDGRNTMTHSMGHRRWRDARARRVRHGETRAPPEAASREKP